jgi:hypothetical protein
VDGDRRKALAASSLRRDWPPSPSRELGVVGAAGEKPSAVTTGDRTARARRVGPDTPRRRFLPPAKQDQAPFLTSGQRAAMKCTASDMWGNGPWSHVSAGCAPAVSGRALVRVGWKGLKGTEARRGSRRSPRMIRRYELGLITRPGAWGRVGWRPHMSETERGPSGRRPG